MLAATYSSNSHTHRHQPTDEPERADMGTHGEAEAKLMLLMSCWLTNVWMLRCEMWARQRERERERGGEREEEKRRGRGKRGEEERDGTREA